MASRFANFTPHRARSYVFRLPLGTRVLLLAVFALWVATIPCPWLKEWGSLIPNKVGLQSMYRFNTFPLLHFNFLHFFFNIIALTPLLERFEAEHGTLPTFLLFTGPFGLLPGALYVLIERFILRGNNAVMGASIWVFLLLSNEAMKTYKSNPKFALGPYSIPTWTTPLSIIFFISFLIPNTSLIGHLCGAAVGYLWGLSYIRFLVPPEKILRWIEGKLNLLGRLPHYVSIDQKTYGRYGVLDNGPDGGIPMGAFSGNGQRLGA